MGLARLANSKVVMVPHVLPSEQVLAGELKQHRSYVEAIPLEIVRPSPDRRLPPCALSGQCGGCHLQHAVYSSQLAIKEEIVREMLVRAGLEAAKGVRPVLASPAELHYRHKVRLHCGRDGQMGFHRAKTHELIPVSSCPLACHCLNDTLARLAAIDAGALFSEFELHCSPSDGTVSALLHLKKRGQQVDQDRLGQIRKQGGLAGIALCRGRRIEPVGNWHVLRQDFSLAGHAYSLQWDCRSFFQVNPRQNEQLVSLVLELAGEISGKKVLDLYCGMGNFTIPLVLAGAEAHGVEVNPHAIRAAAANGERAACGGQARFTATDVGKFVHSFDRAKPDLILVDPPRQGLTGIAAGVATIGAEQIIYISCDPATLFRDLKIIVEQGYDLVVVQPVDMFPQTAHIETVALLEKN